MRNIPRWVIAVVILCCVIEALTVAAQVYWAPPARNAIDVIGGFWPPLMQVPGVYPGQGLAMFVTYGFLHGGLLHLGMNMASLLYLAEALDRFISPLRMAAIYAAAQIGGALVFAWMSSSMGPMIGASGAIFGLAGGLVGYVLVLLRSQGLPLGPLMRSVAVMVGLNLAMTLAMPQIAWEAHLGGAVVGVILGIWFAVQDRDRPFA